MTDKRSGSKRIATAEAPATAPASAAAALTTATTPTPATSLFDRVRAKKGHFDGEFLVGMMTTGEFGLPSCGVRPQRDEEVRLFTTEIAARYAGLRPCKVCKPTQLHRAEADNLAVFETLDRDVTARPGDFNEASALGLKAGLTDARLDDLFRDHAQSTPAAWLERRKVAMAAQWLIGTPRALSEVATDAGFATDEAFRQAFTQRMRTTPQAYRALDAAHGFVVSLPDGYRPIEVLAYHGRDPASLSERSDSTRIWKALTTAEGPVIIEIDLADRVRAHVKVHADTSLSGATAAGLYVDTLAMLGLSNEVEVFERAHSEFTEPRRGLRVPLLASAFDALCWGIIGQQINLRFAAKLRREIIALAGRPIGDMRAHPTPAALAALPEQELTRRQFSRSKAKYLLQAAHTIVEGRLDLDELRTGSAVAAERALTAQHGVGTWTARYVMMRTGFADAAPVGDSGLSAALQRLHQLPERPDAERTARLMVRYAPNRSLASAHLWASLAAPSG